MARNCETCVHFHPEDSTCNEGGFSEIGDPKRELTEEDCNAWQEKMRKWLRAESSDTESLIIFLEHEVLPKLKQGFTSGEDWALEDVE